MSGIYIPDVSLPGEGDFELWIAVRKDGSFTYNVRGGWQDGTQKIAPVPPHGRLIDADKLYRAIKAECNPYGKLTIGFEDGNKVLGMIDRMPTVIPASREEEDS